MSTEELDPFGEEPKTAESEDPPELAKLLLGKPVIEQKKVRDMWKRMEAERAEVVAKAKAEGKEAPEVGTLKPPKRLVSTTPPDPDEAKKREAEMAAALEAAVRAAHTAMLRTKRPEALDHMSRATNHAFNAAVRRAGPIGIISDSLWED